MNWFATYQHYRRWDKSSCCGVFVNAFLNLVDFERFVTVYHSLTVIPTINTKYFIMQNKKVHIYTLKLIPYFCIEKMRLLLSTGVDHCWEDTLWIRLETKVISTSIALLLWYILKLYAYILFMVESRLVLSQSETSLQSNALIGWAQT